MPSGYNRSWFSPQLKAKLEKYIERINNINITFKSFDFNNFDLRQVDNAFFYAAPPISLR